MLRRSMSHVPDTARMTNVPKKIAAGRNRFRLGEIGWWKIALGLVLYAVLLVFHHRLFGAHALI